MLGLAIKGVLCVWLAADHLPKALGMVEPLDSLPPDLQGYLDTCHSSGDLSQQNARLIFWTAINQYTSRFVRSRPDLTPQQSTYLQNTLTEALASIQNTNLNTHLGRKKRQALGPRIRKEIRAMTEQERARYFAAVNAMKNDRRLPPNVYDFLAAYHQGDNIQRAHFGPAFPSWHRLYLWIFEYFLRLQDPTATIPFWASVLDSDMQDSTQSVLWSPAFFGNGDGAIRTGPFQSWPQINPQTVFTRNVQGGELFTVAGINRILSRRRTSEIVVPTAQADSNLETQHGGPHVFVGGTMNNLESAARDPIFFSHHAFVDQIWERFRVNQQRAGINPEADYPFNPQDPRFRPSQAPTANAGFAGLGGAQTWTQNLGYLNAFSNYVQYEEVPACPTCANSPYLYCNQALTPPRCVSRTIAEMASTGLLNPALGRGKRQVFGGLPNDRSLDVCPKRNPFINDFDTKMLGFTDARAMGTPWSYIPVKVVSKRPMEYGSFDKYSLYGHTSSMQLGLRDEFFKRGVQKYYESCNKHQDAFGKITIVAYGLNYDGYSEEYVLLDNRLGVSEAIGYIPVKKPYPGQASEVIISAFDSCGRVCKPYCKRGADMVSNQGFAGAIRVTSASPLYYADSYADAMLNIWDVPSATSCPKVNFDVIPVSFFCEYTDTWIWGAPRGGGQGRGMGHGAGPHGPVGPPLSPLDIYVGRGRRSRILGK